MMSVKEAGRLTVVRQVLDGQLNQAQAAQKLNLSPRTVNAQLSIGINKCADYVRRFREMDHA